MRKTLRQLLHTHPAQRERSMAVEDLYCEPDPLEIALASLLRGSAKAADGVAKQRLSAEDARGEAAEILQQLLSQYPHEYPMQVERHGIRFYLEPNSLFGSGPDQITVMFWSTGRWRPLAELPCDTEALKNGTGVGPDDRSP